MAVHELSRADARRIAIRAQRLDARRPGGLLEVVRDLTMLQVDQTAAVARNADLVVWSRVGPGYLPDELVMALEHRVLIELAGLIRPAEDIALYRADMRRWREHETLDGWRRARNEWVLANDASRRDILARLATAGPLPARELPDNCAVPYKSSGWNNDRNRSQLLELMSVRGEIAVSGRRGTERLWDLAERVYPDDPEVPRDEALRIRDELRLGSLGIARARATEMPVERIDVGDAGEPAVVEGVRGQWRVHPGHLGQPFTGRAAVISPLDRLVYDRKRMVELFEFDYQLEMYKPAAKRRWGYWALPVLYGDRLVGKVDAAADRAAGVLRVNAVHEDVAFTKAMTDAVQQEIESLAEWLGLGLAMPAR